MLNSYKNWIYQRLIKQVKSPNIWSRTPNSVRIRQSGRTGNRGVTGSSFSLPMPILSKADAKMMSAELPLSTRTLCTV